MERKIDIFVQVGQSSGVGVDVVVVVVVEWNDLTMSIANDEITLKVL